MTTLFAILGAVVLLAILLWVVTDGFNDWTFLLIFIVVAGVFAWGGWGIKHLASKASSQYENRH